MGILSNLFGPSKGDYKTPLPFRQWFLEYHDSGDFTKSKLGTALLVQSFSIVNQTHPELPLYSSILMKHKRQPSKYIIDTIVLPELELIPASEFDLCMAEPARIVGAHLLMRIYEQNPEKLQGW